MLFNDKKPSPTCNFRFDRHLFISYGNSSSARLYPKCQIDIK